MRKMWVSTVMVLALVACSSEPDMVRSDVDQSSMSSTDASVDVVAESGIVTAESLVDPDRRPDQEALAAPAPVDDRRDEAQPSTCAVIEGTGAQVSLVEIAERPGDVTVSLDVAGVGVRFRIVGDITRGVDVELAIDGDLQSLDTIPANWGLNLPEGANDVALLGGVSPLGESGDTALLWAITPPNEPAAYEQSGPVSGLSTPDRFWSGFVDLAASVVPYSLLEACDAAA